MSNNNNNNNDFGCRAKRENRRFVLAPRRFIWSEHRKRIRDVINVKKEEKLRFNRIG